MPRSTSITGDALQVRALLSWARSQGIDINRVTVGSCTVDVAPARETPKPASKPRKAEDRATIYGRFGGEAFKAAMESGSLDSDDLVPAVGRK